MGIKTPPIDDPETYEILMISFTGITKGDAWRPGMPEPHNDTYYLRTLGGGWYISIEPDAGVQVIITTEETEVYILFEDQDQQFYVWKEQGYQWAGANEMLDPTKRFFGGHYQITYKLVTPIGPSMRQTMAQLGIAAAAGTKYAFGPVNDATLWQRYARIADGTRLYIRKNNY